MNCNIIFNCSIFDIIIKIYCFIELLYVLLPIFIQRPNVTDFCMKAAWLIIGFGLLGTIEMFFFSRRGARKLNYK